MRACSRLVMLVYLTMYAFVGEVIAADPPLDIKDVRQVREACVIGCLDDKRAMKNIHYLIRMGEEGFSAYETILSDPKSSADEVAMVFLIIGEVKADSRNFLKHAVSRLTDSDFGVRLNAVLLLKKIGSSAEASPVVALLSDKRREVSYAAARTLAAIGGSREVVAIDVWLRGISHLDDGDLRKHIQKCRDALKKRLDEARAKDSSKSAKK